MIINDKFLYMKTKDGFELKIDGEEFKDFISKLYEYFIYLFEGEKFH